MIISIINNKGGVGKTATAINLGHALAKKGKKTLIVDMDTQANSTSILMDDNIKNSLFEIIDPAEDEVSVEDCIYPTKYEHLYILPNISETAILESLLITYYSNDNQQQPKGLYRLKERFREYANMNFDFVLIDNAPSLGTFVINSLRASDFVIVPNEAGSKHSVTGLIKAVKFIEEERINGNPDLRFLKLLITKVDKRLGIHKAMVSQIKEFFPPEKVFKTIIPINTDMQKSEAKSQSVIEYRSNSSSSKAYIKLANELIKTLEDF